MRFENGCYICTPQNIGKFIDRLVELRRKKEKKFSKKNFKKHLPVRNKFSTFAPALKHKRNKIERHVRRHIELTAVLTEMLEQKNKSNGIERFEKPIEKTSNNN